MAYTVKFCFVVPSSTCGVSSEQLNYRKNPMVRLLYRFHVYYLLRRILKKLQVSFPHAAGFNASDNSYTNEEFFKICEDYGVLRHPIRHKMKILLDLSARC